MAAFAPAGPVHRPASPLGWLVTLAALAFTTQVFWAIDCRSHSVTDALYAVYPFWGVTVLLSDWLARPLDGGA